MKVVQVLYSGLGGHGSVVFSLIEADQHNQWQNFLLFYGVEQLKWEYAEKCREKGVPFTEVKKNPGWDFAAIRLVYRQLHNTKPDAIILHSTNLLVPVYAYALLNKADIIMVEHKANQVKRRSEWLWSWAGMVLAKWVVLLTEDYRTELQSRMKWWFRASKVHVIPNGIDVNFFSPALQEQTDKACIRISMVARFSDTKDHAMLLKAFALVRKELQDKNMELVLAGDGENLPVICTLVKELGLETCVQLPGLLSEIQIRDLLRQTTIYAHASLGETMSTAIMQAMACGLPVVASDIPGINNLVQHNCCGLLCEQGNQESFKQSIQILIENESMRNAFAKASRKIAEDLFSCNRMFQQYNKLVL